MGVSTSILLRLCTGRLLDTATIPAGRDIDQSLYSSILSSHLYDHQVPSCRQGLPSCHRSLDNCILLRLFVSGSTTLIQLEPESAGILYQRVCYVPGFSLYRTHFRCHNPLHALASRLEPPDEDLKKVGCVWPLYSWRPVRLVLEKSAYREGYILKLHRVCISTAIRIYYLASSHVAPGHDFTCNTVPYTPYQLLTDPAGRRLLQYLHLDCYRALYGHHLCLLANTGPVIPRRLLAGIFLDDPQKLHADR